MVGIKNPQRGRTFRIQSIPMSVSEDDFTTFLNGLFGDAGPHDFTFSLAVSGIHKVAAVTFTEEVPSAFGQVVAGQRMNLNTKEMKDLVVDCDFIGLTPLSTPEDATVE
jgi:selenophosphate synthetase-related protein